MPLSPGTSLGPYQIDAPLGAGGMGEVYKATDTRLDRTVAIKVLPEHVASDPDLKQRFEREARTVAALNHPHICTLHDIGSQDGIDFLVMEYLDGETVAQRLEKGALPLDQALQIAIDIADALDKAHRQGIVHRDLKPANIMLTKAGAKLLDFGLAKLKPPEQAGGLSALPTQPADLTQQGAILGTFQYMAPEQLEGQEADARTDIFAFGAVVYEMVTGRKAFEGKSQASLIGAIMSSDPPSLGSLQPTASARLDELVKKCLAKDRTERWQAAADIRVALQWETEGTARPVPQASRRQDRRVWMVAAAVVVAGVAILTWALLRTGPSGQGEAVESPSPTGVASVSDTRPALAVLPLANRGGTDEDRHFTDGVHDELRTNLSRIAGLRVVSRGSVEEYRDTPKGAREIGDDLGVGYVLEGAVQRAGGRIRLTLQLIDANIGAQLWGEVFERELTTENLFEIQSEVAQSVAGQLGAVISDGEARRIARRSTANLRAYEYYLRGFVMSNELVEPPRQQVEEAQQLLEAALREDPDFALAHAALSNVHSWFVLRRWDFTESRKTAARTSADRALELDPDLPEGYLARAMYHYRVEKDYDRALASLRLAEPGLRGDVLVALQRAYTERRAGQWEAALRSLERARLLDPRSEAPLRQAAITLLFMRRFVEAEEMFVDALDLDLSNERPDRERLELGVAGVRLSRDGDTGPYRDVFARQFGLTPSSSLAIGGAPLSATRWRIEFLDRDWAAALSVLTGADRPTFENQNELFPISLLRGWTHAAAGELDARPFGL